MYNKEYRMELFTSRYSNPELKSGKYTAIQISLGRPRFALMYDIYGLIPELMPKGLFGKYDYDQVGFKREYFKLLSRHGSEKILQSLRAVEEKGKSVVLLCFEDVRKGDNDWCHRIMFAEWWLQQTGEVIKELFDPTPNPMAKQEREKLIAAAKASQLSLF
jgi:hypothetical protein